MYGAALYRLRPEDFGEIRHADGISPAWPVSYDELRAVVHQGRVAVPGARRRTAPIRPRAAGRGSTRGRRSRTSRGSSRSPTALEAGRLPPVPRAVRDPARTRRDRPASHCIRCATCDGYPCLVHAKADADVIAVRPLLGLPNVTLLTGAEVVRLETDPAGRTVTGVVVDRGGWGARERDGKEETSTTATSSCSRPGAANTAKILLRSAVRRLPVRPGERIGPGRAQLHVPQQQGRGGAGQGAQRHGLPEDPRDQRLLPRRRRPASGRSATSRCSASPTRRR